MIKDVDITKYLKKLSRPIGKYNSPPERDEIETKLIVLNDIYKWGKYYVDKLNKFILKEVSVKDISIFEDGNDICLFFSNKFQDYLMDLKKENPNYIIHVSISQSRSEQDIYYILFYIMTTISTSINEKSYIIGEIETPTVRHFNDNIFTKDFKVSKINLIDFVDFGRIYTDMDIEYFFKKSQIYKEICKNYDLLYLQKREIEEELSFLKMLK